MLSTTKIYHYEDPDGASKTHEAVTHHFSSGTEELVNEVCLVNTCGEHTGFEVVPEYVDKWFDKIGVDFTHFPNLSRLWGDNRSEYAFTIRYELAHERDSIEGHEYPVVLSYDVQLKLLMEAAEKIAEALPDAIVRLSEMGAFCDQHELEIAFLFPCKPETIFAGVEILKTQFDYVWDIGRAPDSVSETPSGSDKPNMDTLVLPNGMAFTAKICAEPRYPGVHIFLRHPDGSEEPICFAEFNSDRPEGRQICVCAYAHNIEEPTYYASYHDDGAACDDV